jgi:hypothetical protein
VHRDRSRRIDDYIRGQLLGSLMRHLAGLVSIEVALVPGGVMGATRHGLLVAARGCGQRSSTSGPAAAGRAVAVAAVAPAAEEENLPAARARDET